MAMTDPESALTRHYLTEWLAHLGWTQERLANEMGVNKSSVSRWARNQRGLKVSDLGLIAMALGIAPADLLEDPNSRTTTSVLRGLGPSELRKVQEALSLLERDLNGKPR